MDALDARYIPGTDKDSVQPFFSPDGRWVGYWSQSDQKMKKVAVSGGAPVVLCDTAPLAGEGSWDTEDTIVYSDAISGIMRVSANGGTPENLIKGSLKTRLKEGTARHPQILPDGKTVLFANLIDTFEADSQIVAQSLESGERKVLVKGVQGKYLPTGHIVYQLANNLFAVPFDLDRLEVTSGSVSVVEGVNGFALSNSGMLAYVPQPTVAEGTTSTVSSANTLVWVDKQGKEEPLGAAPDAYGHVKISPDGTKVALSIGTIENQDLWIWDIPHKTPTKLTFDKAGNSFPLWTPGCEQRKMASIQRWGKQPVMVTEWAGAILSQR